MKALRFHADHDLRIEEVAEPGEPEPDEVVVEVVNCGICGTDLHEYMSTQPSSARRTSSLGVASKLFFIGCSLTRRIV